jgi:hypothetical protein
MLIGWHFPPIVCIRNTLCQTLAPSNSDFLVMKAIFRWSASSNANEDPASPLSIIRISNYSMLELSGWLLTLKGVILLNKLEKT